MEALAGLACFAVAVGLGVVVLGMLVKAAQSGRSAPKAGTNVRGAPQRPGGGYSISVRIGGTERRPGKEDARWLAAGEVVTVAGYSIGGGFLYVGKHLNPVSGWREVEPALINPGLPIDDARCDWEGTQMPYWPSYSEVPPACRAAHLRWLADGRKHPTVGIGYVFLFLYGLERRLLSDARRAPLPAGEGEAILTEIERLLVLYGHQASFRRYASEFLDFSRLQGGVPSMPDDPPAVAFPGQIPLSLRVGLATFSSAGRPVPAAWALAWLRAHPETRLRTPAQRCAEEFEALFACRYEAEFGAGMVVKPNKGRITAAYKPASSSFSEPIVSTVGELPDVTALTAPVRRLQKIAEDCTEDLEAYSRFIGREPGARGGLEAIALLPAELAARQDSPDALRLRDWLAKAIADADAATVNGAELLKLWSTQAGKLSKGEAVLLAQFLQKAGLCQKA
jgi:hypothetical protein